MDIPLAIQIQAPAPAAPPLAVTSPPAPLVAAGAPAATLTQPGMATPADAGVSGDAVPAPGKSGRKPLPNARSRWKKLTGTAMFINRLGKQEQETQQISMFSHLLVLILN